MPEISVPGWATEADNQPPALSANDATTIRWKKYPDKCVEIEGNDKGASLRIWDCLPYRWKQQLFVIPKQNGTGLIRWLAHPHLCLDAPLRYKVQLWNCEGSPAENINWQVTTRGRIHRQRDPIMSLDFPYSINGEKLQVWSCPDTYEKGRKEDVLLQIQPLQCPWEGAWSRFGGHCSAIRWTKDPSKCIDVAGVGEAADLQIEDCAFGADQRAKQQLFLVPSSGDYGVIRWAAHPELCLDVPNNQTIQFWKCSDSPHSHIRWVVSSTGHIQLASDQQMCLDIPKRHPQNGKHLQMWNFSAFLDQPDRQEDMEFMIHPKDCSWESWSDWGPCSAECDGGNRTRLRHIDHLAVSGGVECGDNDNMSQACNVTACSSSTTTTGTNTTTTLSGTVTRSLTVTKTTGTTTVTTTTVPSTTTTIVLAPVTTFVVITTALTPAPTPGPTTTLGQTTTVITTTITTTTTKPEPTSLQFVVLNIDYPALSTQRRLHAQFQEAVTEAIAQECKTTGAPLNVTSSLSPGSVKVEVEIHHQRTDFKSAVEKALGLSKTLNQTVVDAVSKIPSINAATTGTVSVPHVKMNGQLRPVDQPAGGGIPMWLMVVVCISAVSACAFFSCRKRAEASSEFGSPGDASGYGGPRGRGMGGRADGFENEFGTISDEPDFNNAFQTHPPGNFGYGGSPYTHLGGAGDERSPRFNESGYGEGDNGIAEAAQNMGVTVEEYNQIALLANDMGITPEEYLMMMEQAEEAEQNPLAGGDGPWVELGMTEAEYRNMMSENYQ